MNRWSCISRRYRRRRKKFISSSLNENKLLIGVPIGDVRESWNVRLQPHTCSIQNGGDGGGDGSLNLSAVASASALWFLCNLINRNLCCFKCGFILIEVQPNIHWTWLFTAFAAIFFLYFVSFFLVSNYRLFHQTFNKITGIHYTYQEINYLESTIQKFDRIF